MKKNKLVKLLAMFCVTAILCMACGCNIKKQNTKTGYVTEDYTEYYTYDENAEREKYNAMSIEDLEKFAAERGINISGLTDKNAIIDAIINAEKKEAVDAAKDAASTAQKGGTAAPTTGTAAGTGDGKETGLKGTFELQIFAGGYGSECWEKAIDGFQKLNPDLEINAHLDSTVNSQMAKRWSNGSPPDFVFLDGNNMPIDTWIDSGLLLDLTDFYSNAYVYGTGDKVSDQVNSSIVRRKNNRIYQMPMLISTYGMWYDSAYFSQNGYSVPKNYDEFKALSTTLKGKGVASLVYPGQYSGYLVMGMILPAAAAYGQEFFDQVSGARSGDIFLDQRFKKILTKLKEIADSGYILDGSLQYNHITSQTYWLNHAAALIPNGLWLESEMASSTPTGFSMRYYPSVLQDADQPACIIESSVGVGVASKAKNQEAALAFIRYLYTTEQASNFTELSGSPSAVKIDVSGLKITESQKDVINTLNSNAYTHVNNNYTFGSFNTTINDVVNKIVDGSYDVDTAAQKLKEGADRKNAEQ